MVAPTLTNDNADPATKENVLSPKQQQRLEERKAREAKKLAKRQAKWDQKERKAAERARREVSMERKKEEARLEKQVLTPKEIEEAKRREEERALFLKEFGVEGEAPVVVNQQHKKKSAFDSNRLGGHHMA